MARLPDFVLIGAMKAGTTTMFQRLGHLETVTLPQVKEPHFFSDEDRWLRGTEWYASIFDGCDGTTGEASTGYADAATANTVAKRMAAVIPGARLLYALRHPLERMRSHYVHQVLRGRETRPFPSAIADPNSEYVTRSLYGRVIEAYRRHYSRDQLYIYRLEDIDTAGSTIWSDILEHIGVPLAEMPSDRSNTSAEKPQFTRPLLWLWERGLIPSSRLPRPIRRIGKRLLTRDHDQRTGLITSSGVRIPNRIVEMVEADQERMRGLDVVASIHWGDLSTPGA